ncbi:MAG: hypothetical protein ACFCBV_05025 [Phycisphaerales bacterium]
MMPAAASHRSPLMLVAMLVLGLCASLAPAAEHLNDVDRANGLLRRAEANLESVAASIRGRTSPPRGSAGKLLMQRLESALGDINAAKAEREKAPADAEGRAAAVERYAAAANEFNRLREFMVGDAAPLEPETDTGTRLDYQQEQLLRNAIFHIREVEGNAQVLTERTEAMRAIQDQLAIDFRDVDALLGVVANAERKTGFANDTLVQLPEDGRGVPAARQRLNTARAKVTVATDYLRPLDARLKDLINPANYPEFEADHKRLRELSIMFARPEILETDLPMAAETIPQSQPAYDEAIRLARKYARLIQQRTAQGERIEGVGNGFLKNHAAFMERARAEQLALPGKIREDLATAQRYADEAVAEQKPAWFNGGIPQVMGFADAKVTLLASLDATAGASMREQYDATQARLKTQADQLRELIIRENTMPADNYTGEDRDKTIAIAVSGWKVQQDEFEVLKVRIPAEAWKRETKWTYSNGTWYFSDRSRLQVRLLVADHENPELASDRPVNVIKDHQAGDTMIGVPMWGFEDELPPSSYMLRSNIK